MSFVTLIFLLLTLPRALAFESLSYSGRLVKSDGSPVSGNLNLTFDLIYSSQPGAVLCTQDLEGVGTNNGVFHVKLDFPSCDLAAVLAGTPLNETVKIRVVDRTPILPKVYPSESINSVPFSFISQSTQALSQMGATDGQVLSWNDTIKKWMPRNTAVLTEGTVKSITATNGLSGGVITETGFIGIAPGGVVSSMISDGGVVDADISGTAEIAQSKIKNLTTDLAAKEGSLPAGTSSDYLDGTKTWQNFNESVRSTLLIGLGTGTAAPITDTNTFSEALENLQAQIIANDTAVDSTGQWSKTGDKIFYNSDNVGIGTTNPNDKLDVVGNLQVSGGVKLKDSGSNYVMLKAPAVVATPVIYTLPGSYGASGEVLQTNASGALSWVTPSVNSSSIVDGSIVDADVAAGAEIAQSKVSGLTTTLTNIQNSISGLSTDNVSEGTPWYFTEGRVLGTDLAGLNTTNGVITSGDTVLSSIGKMVGNLAVLSSAQSNYVLKSGDTMSGALQMGGKLIKDLAPPSINQDVATKKYVDDTTTAAASKWNKNVNDISYTAGNVGIGAMAPVVRLKVNGANQNSNFDVSNSQGTMVLTDMTTPSAVGVGGTILFGSTYHTSGATMGTGSIGTFKENAPDGTINEYNHALVFKTNQSTFDILERMRITSEGKVGVGTPAPTHKLDVVGDVGISGKLMLKSSTANNIDLMAPAGLASNLSYIFPSNSGGSGHALTTNGAGVLAWSPVATTSTSFGGDFTGTIASAELSAATVGTSELIDGSVTNAKLNLADGTISQAKITGLVTALSNKEPSIALSDSTRYWRGDKTWQPFDTSAIPEGVNLYFLDSRVRDTLLSGYSAGANQAVAGTDTLLEALGKLEGKIIAHKALVDNAGIWTKSGSNIFHDGNVGVGSTAPESKFEIGNKAIVTPLEISDHALRIHKDTDFGGISLLDRDLNPATTNDINTVLYYGDDATDNLHLSRYYFSDGSLRHDLTVLGSDGKVGIGITVPLAPLHVEKNLGVAATENWLVRAYNPSGTGVVMGYESNGTSIINAKVRSASNSPLVLGTSNNKNALTINDNKTAHFFGRPLTSYSPSMTHHLGNHDWSDLVTMSSGSIAYSAADGGMRTSGASVFFVKLRMPIDPLGVYRATVRIKNLNGTGTYFVGANSLSDSYSTLMTDLANSYNYFAAASLVIPIGQTVTVSGTISGHNLASEGNRNKFDPGAKFFDLIIITNYQAAGESVIEAIEVYKEATPENWIAPTFENGWLNYNNGFAPVGFYKDAKGIVHLRGFAQSGVVGPEVCLFTLPAGYRPEFRTLLNGYSYPDTHVRIDVKSDGCVTTSNADNTWVSLDDLSFRAIP